MVPETASCLVGLIAVDGLPSRQNDDRSYSPDTAAPDTHALKAEDATLEQFLLFLSGSSALPRGVRPDGPAEVPGAVHGPYNLPGGRFEQGTPSAWPQPIRLLANLKALATQLDLAVANARRQVAVARRLGG